MKSPLLPNNEYNLVKEMFQGADAIRDFDLDRAFEFARPFVAAYGSGTYSRILFTGEGSSRIFPAKRALYENNKGAKALPLFTEGSTQALEYDLSKTLVSGASNSGRTKELIRLFRTLKDQGHEGLFGITASEGSLLGELAAAFVLGCGGEKAVAATKSVLEQALVVQFLVHLLNGGSKNEFQTFLAPGAKAVEAALTQAVPPTMVDSLAKAGKIYFAGRNNGVAEELALKTNEITRKDSAYLEGTIAVHGIEEIMNPGDALVIIDPFAQEEETFQTYLEKGVGVSILAISDRKTLFPTLHIPKADKMDEYAQLAAGWNLLLKAGISLGIDVDTPTRARKVGNEFVGS